MRSERRLHPISILFALSGSLKTFALPAVVLILSSLRGSSGNGGGQRGPAGWFNRWTPFGPDLESWQIWLLFFFVVGVASAVLRYLTFRLTYEGDELVIRSGLLFRNERHVPYDRVQNLDATRSLVHRVFGVAEVRVETGGGAEPEARISVLRESEFEEMRRRVFEARTRDARPAAAEDGAVTAAPPAVQGQPAAFDTLLHLPTRELLLLGLLDNRAFLLIAAAYGVLWESGLQGVLWERLSARFAAPGAVSSIWEGLMARQAPSFGLLALMAVGLLALVAFIRVLSMAWVSVTLHDFRLVAAGEDLRTEYGLLTRVTTTVPRRRIQSLTVREAPLQRWCRRASIVVQTAGSAAASPQSNTRPRERLAPIVRADAVPALVRHLLPNVDVSNLAWQPLHPRALRRACKPLLVLHTASALGLLAVAGLASWPAVLAYFALGAIAAVAITRQQVRRMGWALNEQVVAVRSGWLWRSLTVAPVAKIQTVTSFESPFDRRTRMASVAIDTAGGSTALPKMRIPYLAQGTAMALAANLATKAAQTAFRW